MKLLLSAAAVLAAGLVAAAPAHAQKEAVGMMYEIQIAPKVCGWTDAGDSKKLDATVASQEKALGVTPADKVELMKAAEADLRSDKSNCAPGGFMRSMYDEAIK